MLLEEQALIEWIDRFIKFGGDDPDAAVCPVCGEKVESVRMHQLIEVDSWCAYAEPCGCRTGQRSAAPKWAIAAGRVEYIRNDYVDWGGPDDAA